VDKKKREARTYNNRFTISGPIISRCFQTVWMYDSKSAEPVRYRPRNLPLAAVSEEPKFYPYV